MVDKKCKCFDMLVNYLTLSMVKFACIWFWAFISVCLVLTGICAIPGIGFGGLDNFGRHDFTITND